MGSASLGTACGPTTRWPTTRWPTIWRSAAGIPASSASCGWGRCARELCAADPLLWRPTSGSTPRRQSLVAASSAYRLHAQLHAELGASSDAVFHPCLHAARLLQCERRATAYGAIILCAAAAIWGRILCATVAWTATAQLWRWATTARPTAQLWC